ncbi:MAG: outer membrane lipoprotein carrier protein LolA [Bacteroidales bacterium]|nr:outer membrane lipoprotein carrier protein LolA [Bacteroidales bacterium]
MTNHKFTGLAIGLLLIIFTLNLAGQSLSVQDSLQFAEGMKKMAANTKTIQSNFTQEKHSSFLTMAIKSEGKFYYQKENKIRWEYNKPYEYTIILSGGSVMINDGGRKSEYDMAGNKIFEEINSVMIATVSGDITDSERFNVSMKKEGKLLQVTLHPKQKQISQILSQIILYISPKDYTVTSLKMVEPNNDYTFIKFMEQRINESIPANTFSFN